VTEEGAVHVSVGHRSETDLVWDRSPVGSVPDQQAAGGIVDSHGREAPAPPEPGHPAIARVALWYARRHGQRFGGSLTSPEQGLKFGLEDLRDDRLAPLPISFEVLGKEV